MPTYKQIQTTGNVNDLQRSGRHVKRLSNIIVFIVTTSRRNLFIAASIQSCRRVTSCYWRKVMWSNCSDHAAFRKSSSSKTSHCRTINPTSPTIPQRFGQHCSSLDTETIKLRYCLLTSRDLTSSLQMEDCVYGNAETNNLTKKRMSNLIAIAADVSWCGVE